MTTEPKNCSFGVVAVIVKMEKRHLKIPAVMKHITIDMRRSNRRTPYSLPSHFFRRREAFIAANLPGSNIWVVFAPVELCQGCLLAMRSIHGVRGYELKKRMPLRKIDRHLPALCHAQVGVTERSYRREAVANRHLVESIEKAQRCFLVFQRILVPVIALGEFDSIAVSKTLVETTDFRVGLMSTLHRKEIESCGSHHHRTRIHCQ